jgi:hypothetical protein
MSESATVPASWSELIAKVVSNRDRSFRSVEKDAAWLQSESEDSLAIALIGPSWSLARLSVTLGPTECAPAFTRFDSNLEAAIELVEARGLNNQFPGAVVVLQYINNARCAGLAVPESAVGAEAKWLPALAPYQSQMSDKDSYTMALAALALGAFDLVPTFSGGGSLPASIEPGQKFQFNVQKLIRYMAAAAVQGAKVDDVSPAFREFVLTFPFKLGAKSLDWTDLLYAARAYYVHFERRPAETVAQTLHELVTSIAAGSSLPT